MLTRLRFLTCLVAWSLCFPYSSCAFDTPLSDTAVRDAYFLGQHRDQTMAEFLSKYTKQLPIPATGPYINSIRFLTPFALMVQYSSQQLNYSAQQAQLDHEASPEIVRIRVDILLTQSYGPFLVTSTESGSTTPLGVQLRPPDFWRDVHVRVFDGKEEITTDDVTGQPLYSCSEYACTLSGASIWLQFPADAFKSDCATIEVNPPQGDQVAVDFDLASLR